MADARTIGIDLGGTQVRVALVEGGRLLARAAEPTDVAGGPRAVLSQFRRLMEKVLPPAGWSGIDGIGICSPGPLDSETGTILGIPTLPGWEGLPMRDILAQETGRPVVLENDGIAAAHGEWRHGAGQGLRHLVYVTVSTGIGGGVVLDGRLLHGRRGMVAHVGHLPLSLDGPRCACGGIGCFEAFASGTALARAATLAVASHPDSALARLGTERITARHVVEAARQDDALAQSLLTEEARYLGTGFTALLHLYSPDAIIMGGGVSQGYDLLEPDIRRTVQERALPAFREVSILRAALGEDSGLIGAASLVPAGQDDRHVDGAVPVSWPAV
ncbi:ROK family protein [Rubellimicrobium arenae]|uniref:ROK family protein n=1 Tax=Rubellimicrobium arenae TaxID=2817372 RepID=UPI001B310B05|nr:ROK family protein [Rubellimicrobium arenae]